MENGRSYEVTPKDVTTIMGIPSFGSNIVIHYKRATFKRLYSLSNLIIYQICPLAINLKKFHHFLMCNRFSTKLQTIKVA